MVENMIIIFTFVILFICLTCASYFSELAGDLWSRILASICNAIAFIFILLSAACIVCIFAEISIIMEGSL